MQKAYSANIEEESDPLVKMDRKFDIQLKQHTDKIIEAQKKVAEFFLATQNPTIIGRDKAEVQAGLANSINLVNTLVDTETKMRFRMQDELYRKQLDLDKEEEERRKRLQENNLASLGNKRTSFNSVVGGRAGVISRDALKPLIDGQIDLLGRDFAYREFITANPRMSLDKEADNKLRESMGVDG